jgi:hypothetical protein
MGMSEAARNSQRPKSGRSKFSGLKGDYRTELGNYS